MHINDLGQLIFVFGVPGLILAALAVAYGLWTGRLNLHTHFSAPNSEPSSGAEAPTFHPQKDT